MQRNSRLQGNIAMQYSSLQHKNVVLVYLIALIFKACLWKFDNWQPIKQSWLLFLKSEKGFISVVGLSLLFPRTDISSDWFNIRKPHHHYWLGWWGNNLAWSIFTAQLNYALSTPVERISGHSWTFLFQLSIASKCFTYLIALVGFIKT